MDDGIFLMYMRDGIAYPVTLTESEYNLLQMLVKPFEPLKVKFSMPQGKVENVSKKKENEDD